MSGTSMHRPDGSHRVVVTGLGAVSGFGTGLAALEAGVQAGRTAIRKIERSRLDMTLEFPAAVPEYDATAFFDHGQLLYCEPFVRHAVIAAREAVAAAGLAPHAAALAASGIFLGCGGGGELTREEAFLDMVQRQRPRVHPLTVPKTNHQAAVSHIASELGIKGPSNVIATGCASGGHALAQALLMVRHGYAALALAGGTEASAILSVAAAFRATSALSTDSCRPFSRDRSGFAIGEGAGLLVLESLESALARGTEPLVELAGFGLSTDPADQVQTTRAGPIRAMQSALADAGLAPEQIDYVNAHGTATPLNDRIETEVIKAVFGAHSRRLAVSSSKSQIGHCFGAAGALEAVITILGMLRGWLPPTVNWLGADPNCDLDYVVSAARPQNIGAALSNSFAFGGLNAVLAFRRL